MRRTLSILMLFALPLLSNCGGCGDRYSEGVRVGSLVKLSERGLVYKSWEGQLHVGATNTSTSSNVWDFSCRNPQVVRKLQEAAQRSEVPVKIVYKEWWWAPTAISTSYEALDVQPL